MKTFWHLTLDKKSLLFQTPKKNFASFFSPKIWGSHHQAIPKKNLAWIWKKILAPLSTQNTRQRWKEGKNGRKNLAQGLAMDRIFWAITNSVRDVASNFHMAIFPLSFEPKRTFFSVASKHSCWDIRGPFWGLLRDIKTLTTMGSQK